MGWPGPGSNRRPSAFQISGKLFNHVRLAAGLGRTVLLETAARGCTPLNCNADCNWRGEGSESANRAAHRRPNRDRRLARVGLAAAALVQGAIVFSVLVLGQAAIGGSKSPRL